MKTASRPECSGGTGVSRRRFLAGTTAAGGSLLLGFRMAAAQQTQQPEQSAPNAFIRIDRTGAVTLLLPYVEMGQGAYTAQAQLLAEELDVGLDQISLVHAPPDETVYSHPVWGGQITGGSGSLSGSWLALRQAGANARAWLIVAAATHWEVDAESCITQRAQVVHPPTARRIGYGDLVQYAGRQTMPEQAALKSTDAFVLIGRSVKRLDTAAKVDGSAKFGIDALPDNVTFAAVMASPVFNAKLARVDDTRARLIRGVRQIVMLEDAVAVVADHTWAARKGLAALQIAWTERVDLDITTARLVAECDEALGRSAVVARKDGDMAAASAAAASSFEAIYRQPMLAHLAMEPINCTVHVRDGSCDVWVGSQVLGRAQKAAAAAAGVPLQNVRVHNHFLGGGFGRRLEFDYVTQAVLIGRQVKGPVKVIWSREEDVRHDYFRYHNHSKVRVGLDAANRPLSWHHRVAGPAVMPNFLPQFFKDGIDYDVIGGATGPYDLHAVLVDYVRTDPPAGLKVGNWRGVGHTRNAFVVESVIDELAHRAGIDPVVYRRSLLTKSPRSLAVLELAAHEAGWGKALEHRQGRGVSLLEGFGSYIAQVAEVRVDPMGVVRVERVVCAVDCGVAVNPDIVRAQIEGGIIFGVSAALYGQVTVANARVEQGNFDTCSVLRMHEAPRIEVHIVSSHASPGGVGEPGTSAVQPAVTNAIFSATGKRLRSLPVNPALLRSA